MSKRNFLSIICFVLIVSLIGSSLSKVFVRKGDLTQWEEFYQQPDNSIDIVILGSSLVACALDPFMLGAKTGCDVYNMSVAGQTYAITDTYVKEVLKTQQPKLIIIETYRFIGSPEMDTDDIEFSISGLKMSVDKLKLIKEIPMKQSDNRMELLVRLFATHNRWNSLKEEDFDFNGKSIAKTRGFGSPKMGLEPQPQIQTPTDEISGISDTAKQCFDKILLAVEGTETKLLFFNPPNPETDAHGYAAYNAIYEYLDSRGVDYLDCNYQEDIVNKIDTSVDYTDYHHTNGAGLYKTTDYLAEYINGKYQLSGTYSRESADYQEYLDRKNETIQQTTNLKTYLMELYDDDYECFIDLHMDTVGSDAEQRLLRNLEYKEWQPEFERYYAENDDDVMKIMVKDSYSDKIIDLSAVKLNNNASVVHYQTD